VLELALQHQPTPLAPEAKVAGESVKPKSQKGALKSH